MFSFFSRNKPTVDVIHLPGADRSLEIFWVDNYEWLSSKGYKLRDRYNPSWNPSWAGTRKHFLDCEDGQQSLSSHIMDGVRISDSVPVMLKRLQKSVHPHEIEIAQFFSSPEFASRPNNHCVPLYEVLTLPNEDDTAILVMPLLKEYDKPAFDTIQEVMEFFGQVFEGLLFMHDNRVAHRDCMNLNIMMDATPLYPVPYHPVDPQMRRDFNGVAQHYTRTRKPVKYYLIDFGISRQYESDSPLEYPIWGGDKTVPEFQKSDEPCNPFPTDVYYLGNMIRGDFLEGDQFTVAAYGFEFMQELVADMVQDDPSKRPSMKEVLCRFNEIRSGLSRWKLGSRFVRRDESSVVGTIRSVSHWSRHAGSYLWS